MTPQSRLHVPAHTSAALHGVQSVLRSRWPVEKFVVFGSVARGEATASSDLDLLVVTSQPVSHRDRHAMSDLIFDINLQHGTSISIVVVDRAGWDTGLWSLLPIHAEIERDGVIL